MKTVLNIKTDIEVKDQAKRLAGYLGIPLSTVVNSYLKEFINSGSFSVAREPGLKPGVRKELEKQMNDARNGKNISQAFFNAEDAIAWLNK